MSDVDVIPPEHSTTAQAKKQGENTTIEFLNKLRPPPWILIAINPDTNRITVLTAHTEGDVVSFIKLHNGKDNVYYSVNPTRTAVSSKPKKIDIARIEYLLGDLAPRENEKSEDAKKRYLDQLNDPSAVTPTAIVDSGNGIQGLWRLKNPIDLSQYPLANGNEGKPVLGPEALEVIADVEDRAKAIMERLGAKAGTQNIDRILRLPGTTNLPTKTKKAAGRVECPTRLLSFNGVSYPLEAFVPGTPEDGGHHARQEQAEEGAHEEGGDKLEWTIRTGGDFLDKGKRSDGVWYVVCEMIRRGYPECVIGPTLLNRGNKISDHIHDQPNPRTYVERQIAKAKAKIPRPKVEVLPVSQWFGEKPAATPPALVKGILPQTGVATIGGQSGAGKSFQAIHLGVRLIPDCHQRFYIDRYPIKRHGGVLYLVLEGKPSFPMRVTAAFKELLPKQLKFGDRGRLPFAWNTYAPGLFEKGPEALLKLADREAQRMRREFSVDLVAVMLDTMGLAACYENEDRAAQVQRVVSGLNRLSDATGALVINVDHMGKDQDAGLRGTSAKRDCVETILTCLIDRGRDNKPINHRMQLFKIRDGEEGRVIPYRLRPIDMGKDDDGDPVTTCVIQWEPGRAPPKGRQAPKKKQTDVNLERAIKEVGLPADPDQLRAAFYKYHGGKPHAANAAWNRVINNKLEVDRNGLLDYAELD